MSTLLLVEDNPVVRIVLVEILSSYGFIVHVACDAEEALEILAENTDIELVVSDIQMPGMDGFQLYAEVKKLKRNLPFVLLSAHDDDQIRLQARLLGVDLCRTKPVVDPAVFSAELHSLIAKYAAVQRPASC